MSVCCGNVRRMGSTGSERDHFVRLMVELAEESLDEYVSFRDGCWEDMARARTDHAVHGDSAEAWLGSPTDLCLAAGTAVGDQEDESWLGTSTDLALAAGSDLVLSEIPI
jgi:hypothetical protein